MIFQEPMSSLNPSLKCGFQVQEILLHTRIYQRQETLSLFEKVKLPDPEIVFDKYPHEISGGKQRVMIAMAIACKTAIINCR
jgi:peptide/nickel transport system ATP-binding protein